MTGDFSMEVHHGNSLYIFTEELMRWRELLETPYRQYRLEKRRLDGLYSQ